MTRPNSNYELVVDFPVTFSVLYTALAVPYFKTNTSGAGVESVITTLTNQGFIARSNSSSTASGFTWGAIGK